MTTLKVARPGVFRRHVRTRAVAGAVYADVEDDAHRFGVTMRHEGGVVTRVEGRAIRTPWTLCSDAQAALSGLVGMRLAPTPLAAARHTDQKQQCTHMFDLAAIAISHAARGIGEREYRVEAPWYEPDAPRTMTLRRDGELLWTWTLVRDRIVAPEPFAAIGVRPLLKWCEQHSSDPDMLEAIFVMRRAVLVSGTRTVELDLTRVASDTGHGVGACFVHHRDRIHLALRNRGTTLDFTDDASGMLADFDAITGRVAGHR